MAATPAMPMLSESAPELPVAEAAALLAEPLALDALALALALALLTELEAAEAAVLEAAAAELLVAEPELPNS